MGQQNESAYGPPGLSAEEKLSIIARTPKWEFPEEFTQFRKTLSDSVNALNRTRKPLSDSQVFDCSAQEKAQRCSEKIVQAVQEADLEQQLENLQKYIDKYNWAIDEARNVRLPGIRLTEEGERAIMDATEPLDMVVPGLGVVTGLAGVAGVKLVSSMLSGHREEQAEKKFDEIMGRIKEKVRFKPAPFADINGIWPDNRPSDDRGSTTRDDDEDGGSRTSGGVSGRHALTGTVTGVAAAAVLAARGVPAGVGTVPLPPRNPTISGAVASGTGIQEGSSAGRIGTSGSGADRKARMPSDGSDGSWDGSRRDAMSVDGGMDGLNGAGVNGAGVVNGAGRAVLAAGAGAGLGAGGTLAAGRLMASGSSMGALGAMSGAGGAGMASISGAGIGSYYANEPVKATPVSSSIKGATGLAAGLRKGASASSAGGAASHGASPAMMGAGRGGSSGSEGKRRNTMGYIAPKIEDDEEFVPKPLAAMAGRRKRPGE